MLYMKVLVFAPHNDDEVLGVGGTIAKYAAEGHAVYVCEITSGLNAKILQMEAEKAHQILGVKETLHMNLPAVKLKNMDVSEINDSISNVIKRINPEIVFTPFIGDMHIDHREVTESVLVATRPIDNSSIKTVYMYETLSETGWNIPNSDRSFIPDTWIDITDYIDHKINAMKCFESQIKEYPNPRSEASIKAMAMYRGSTVSIEYAEAFMLIRNIIR